MPKAATPEAPPRYVLGAGGAVEILLPDGLSCVPDRVRELNDEAVRAHDAAVLAGRQLQAAKTGRQRAEAVDRAADQAADAAGTALPSKRAVEGAQEALTLAERRYEAAKQNSRDATIELARGIHRDRAAWLIEQEGVEAAIQADLRETLATLTTQLAALDRERRVLDQLREFPAQGALGLVNFGRPGPNAEVHEASRAAVVEKEVAKTPGNVLRSTIPRTAPHLLAELRRQVETVS